MSGPQGLVGWSQAGHQSSDDGEGGASLVVVWRMRLKISARSNNTTRASVLSHSPLGICALRPRGVE